MITSNYANPSSNLSAPTRAAGAILENQPTSEVNAKQGNSWDLRSYASEASQDVQNLKNGPDNVEEPNFYQLNFSIGDGARGYSIQAQVFKMSEQDTYPPFPGGGVQKSRLYHAVVVSDELAKDYPELVGRPLVMDIAQGIDSRVGVQMGLQTLLADAKANKGNLGSEPRTGAQIYKGEKGYEAIPVGGKDGVKIPPFKMPAGGFDLK